MHRFIINKRNIFSIILIIAGLLVSSCVATDQGDEPEVGEKPKVVVDITPPVVKSISPSSSSLDVSPFSAVLIEFSEPMDGDSINSDSVYIEGVDSDITYNQSFSQVVLRPLKSLLPASNYTIVVTSDVLDVAGNAIGKYSYSYFTTGEKQTILQGPTGSESVFAHSKFNRTTGSGLIVWVAKEESTQSLLASRYSAQTGRWGEVEAISIDNELGFFGEYSSNISIAAVEDTFIVAWTQSRKLYTRKFNGDVWEEIILHHRSGNVEHYDVQIESDKSTFMLIWQYDSLVRAKVYTEGEWGEENVLSNPENLSTKPKLVTNGTNYMVQWSEWVDGSRYSNAHYFSSYDNKWSQPVRIDAQTGHIYGDGSHLLVNGEKSIFIWMQKTNEKNILYSRTLYQGEWSNYHVFYNDGPGSILNYSLVLGSSGYLVAWNVFDGKNYGIFGSTLVEDNWSDSEISPLAAGKITKIDGSATKSGFALVWNRENGDFVRWNLKSSDLYGSVYDKGAWSGSTLLEKQDGSVDSYNLKVMPVSEGLSVWWIHENSTHRVLNRVNLENGSWNEEEILEEKPQDIYLYFPGLQPIDGNRSYLSIKYSVSDIEIQRYD